MLIQVVTLHCRSDYLCRFCEKFVLRRKALCSRLDVKHVYENKICESAQMKASTIIMLECQADKYESGSAEHYQATKESVHFV